jgi:hypothetical protein
MNGTANGLYGGDLPNQINTPWIDFSEQSTIVGWSSFTVKRYRYKVVGNIVYVNIGIDGTSNSTSTNFTLPVVPKFNSSTTVTVTVDNGNTTLGGRFIILANTLSVDCQRPTSGGNLLPISTWTASGNKQVSGVFFYEI